MSRIVIPYATGAGHTRRLAELVAEGAGPDAALIDVEAMAGDGVAGPDWDALHAAEAIIFGAPTYMGSASAAFKVFMDRTSDFWDAQRWADKLAGGFTVGSYPGGDKLSTLTQLVVFATQHGMVWVGQSEIGGHTNPSQAELNADGHNLGLAATSSRDKSLLIDPGDAETARRYGARIAAAARRWRE